MSVISIRLPEKLQHEIADYARALHIPQAQYIREAITHMNNEMALKKREQRLTQASLRVRKESIRVNAEFDEIEHDPET